MKLTREQELAIANLPPSHWPEPFRTQHINRQWENERRKEAAILAHAHRWSTYARLCERCGCSEEAHEATIGSDAAPLGLLCVPDLLQPGTARVQGGGT